MLSTLFFPPARPNPPLPQLADFLAAPMARAAGSMMPLPDVYCLYNRARGTELISPDDLLQAIRLFPRVRGAGRDAWGIEQCSGQASRADTACAALRR